MPFDPHLPTRAAVLNHFAADAPVAAAAAAFFAAPTHAAGRDLLRAYFKSHRPGDVAGLRMAVASFADKRLVRGVVQSVLDDEETLSHVAAKSYPHPIGFDKLVLDDDRDTGFKFRLHVYWRGANFAALERLHLHRFEMASAVVTGELTNHVWRVAEYRPANAHLPAVDCRAVGAGERKAFAAYSGYRRDANGQLRKTLLGDCVLEKGPAETFTSGDAYAQVLEDAHFVETNAETGFANGDFCSTVYVHGPSLKDAAGRTLPVLFEEQRLADDDQLIQPIPAMTPEDLRKSLTRYRDTLDEILAFYDWLYDPKHGRNLSAGMVAGYLLCEAFNTPHAIDAFEKQYDRCKEILQQHETAVRDCLAGRGCPPAGRCGRYINLLVAKAKAHPAGPAAWLVDNGSLTKEMWRYFGAIRGEAGPAITVLKPVWAGVVKRKLPGGMHHGPVAAMIEAAYDANHLAMQAFAAPVVGTAKDEYNVTCAADAAIETHIVRVLKGHYPAYHFHGEEGGDSSQDAPQVGDRRFLIDPIDGTRNFVSGREEFAVSIACQLWTAGGWETTEAVVSHPPTGQIFWAERGAGAFLIERNDLETRLFVPPAPAASETPLHGQLIDFSATGLGIDGQVAVFRDLLTQGARFRNGGSVGRILARLAGRGGTGAVITAKDHDVEAALLIAKEAGATATQFTFTRPHGRVTATVAAVTPAIHAALTAAVAAAISPAGGANQKPGPVS